MALHWKLVVDSTDPHAQADFWAAALDYHVEDPGALVSELLHLGRLPEADAVTHLGTHRFAALAAVRHPDDPFDSHSGAGLGRRILFQRVPEHKQGKNRLHIDVHDGGGDPDTLAARLEAFGATRVEFIDEGPIGRWWIMQDPEGNEFCAIG